MKLYHYLSIMFVSVLMAMPLQAGATRYAESHVFIENLTGHVCELQRMETDYNRVLNDENFSIEPGAIDHIIFEQEKFSRHEEKRRLFQTLLTYQCGDKFVSIELLYRRFVSLYYAYSVGSISSDKDISVVYHISHKDLIDIELIEGESGL